MRVGLLQWGMGLNGTRAWARIYCFYLTVLGAAQVVLGVKNPRANAGDVRDLGSIPGLRRSPGRGHGNPLQYSCLENPVDRGVWRATVHRFTKSWTWLKWLSRPACSWVLSEGHWSLPASRPRLEPTLLALLVLRTLENQSLRTSDIETSQPP